MTAWRCIWHPTGRYVELGIPQANSGVSWHRCRQGHRLFLPFSSTNFHFLATLLTFHLRATESPSAPGPLIGKKGGIFLDKSFFFFFREENVIYKQSQHHPLRLFHLPPASRLILGLLAWVRSQSHIPIWGRPGKMSIRHFWPLSQKMDSASKKEKEASHWLDN